MISEKARLQAEAMAAEEVRRKAEAKAAAEAKRQRELEREAARQALIQVRLIHPCENQLRCLFGIRPNIFFSADGKDC